jgi:hypothetical protein
MVDENILNNMILEAKMPLSKNQITQENDLAGCCSHPKIGLKESEVRLIDAYFLFDTLTDAYLSVFPDLNSESRKKVAGKAHRSYKRKAIKREIQNRKMALRYSSQKLLSKALNNILICASYDHQSTYGLSNLTKKISGMDQPNIKWTSIPDELRPFIKNFKSKVISVRQPDGSDRLERVSEYELGPKFTFLESLKAFEKALSVLKLPEQENTIFSTNDMVTKWWNDFKNKDITALDMAHNFTSIGLKVPEVIMIQAKKEIELMDISPNDDDEDGDSDDISYEEMDKRWVKFQIENRDQLEKFLPGREQEILELYKKYGFDTAEKPIDEITDDNNIIDPEKEN